MASAMVMPTPTPEPAPALFSEGDPLVLVVYFSTFLIWTAAAGNDFISSSWRTVGDTRRRGKLHVALVFIPMTLITAYIAFQHITKDYKEMGAALIALAFALLHLSRTFMGLWQLHVFKQWTISSIKSMESLGYETRLQEVAAPCVEDADTDEEEDDFGSESESDSAPSSEETDSDEEEGNVGTESERGRAPRGVQIERDEEEDNVGSENGSGTVEERKGGDNSEEEIVNEAQGDAKSNGGRSDGGNGDNTQQRGCWFPGLLKNLPCASTKGAEWERIERIADKILVNDTLMDNRLSDVHTVCNFRFLSKDEEKKVRRVRLHSKDEMKTLTGALKGALLTLKRLCLRIRYGFPRAFCVFRVLYSLAFLKNPHMPNLHSAPRLVPRRPESIWLNWAAALVAQAGWVLQDPVLIDPDPSAGYTENRNRFAEQVLLSASLHTQRMTAAGTSTSTSNERRDKTPGLLSFRDWHNYPELCKGRFSKQELLKRACKTGNGLPYCMRHREAKEAKDKWGYSKFKSELQRAREALPPELETRVSEFDVGQLEWFAIFVSVKDWAPWNSSMRKEDDVENQGDSRSDDSKSTSDSAGEVKENKAEAENDIPIENVKKQLGFGEDPNFILGRSKSPFLRSVPKALLWGNRNVLEISCHIDNWIALCAGEQTSYMVERVSKMKQDLRDSYAYRRIDEIVAASAKFEYCRFLCQMGIIRPEHNHFDKSMTFLGCSMEMLRSSLAKWGETLKGWTWKPRLIDIVSGTNESGNLGGRMSLFKGTDDFTSCIRSLEKLSDMSKCFVKMRVLWEVQNHFQTHLLKKKIAAPNSLEAIALCILSFPAVSVKVMDRRDSCAAFRMGQGIEERVEVVQGREVCCIAVHGEDEKQFAIQNYEYVIHSSCGPQDLQLVLSFEPLRENSNAALSLLLCEMEGQNVDYFDWEIWRNAFYGRLEACRQWKAKIGVSNFALIAPTDDINAGIEKVAGSTTIIDAESDIGTEMSIWKGWPPHCTSICVYELSTEDFILHPRQVEGVSVPVSMGEGRTFRFEVPQEIWWPVEYAEANETSFKKASLVAQRLLTRNEDISLAPASDTDVSVALRAAVEQEILQLQSSVGKKDAVFRGVALLERFYVYGTHCPGKTRCTTDKLSSFFCNDKYVEAVRSLFEKMFKASEYDKHVAERYQLFLMFGMRYTEEASHENGLQVLSRENALQVMFRSIVYRCYFREVAESVATILVSVLPFHSNGSFEEYVALILAYLNAGKEIEAAGHDSLLEGVRDAANERLDIVKRAVFKEEGGRRFLEALGLSAHDEADETVIADAVVQLLLREPLTEEYHPRPSAPALSHMVNLDFDASNIEGMPATPEGILKRSVLISSTSSTVTAATGVMKPSYGIVGMSGVGKTVALQGLAHDKDIQIRFPDGVFYMTLGQGATVQTVLRQLVKILTITGSTKIAAIVGGCFSLRDAVDHATSWFKRRICLFLVDDVWPTNDCKTGFLLDLRQLLRDSPDSRMAITTRSTTIAQCAGALVPFGARDPLGSASMKIFMAHATSGSSDGACANLGSEARNSVLKILTICAGLPIALAVTGSTVAFLSSAHGDFEGACESYAIRLEKKSSYIGDAYTIEDKTLTSCMLLSLEYLEVEFLKWKAEHSQVTSHSISDLYTGLCVLENQAWVSVSVLERLWRLDNDAATDVMNLFCGMSLATLHWRQASSASAKEAGIVLHDLQLDFCQWQAYVANTSSRWHAELLTGYLETTNHPAEEPGIQLITSFIPRPWWSNAVPEDGYIYSNLSRHLACAGQGLELAGLLLEGRWMELRRNSGGILALVSDFEILDSVFLNWERLREQHPLEGDVRRQFDQICKVVQLSWGRMIKGLRAFQFQVCSRLVSLRKSSIIANAFVESIEKCTPEPFLLPLNSFFSELDSALIMEIPLGEECLCVACSPCGQFIAAGAGKYILVAKSSTGEILQRLGGHKELVMCLTFATESKNIVSGSEDGTVMMWEWESSESPVLEGRDDGVSGVAVNSHRGRIFSSSVYGTVRIWSMMTGAETGALQQSDPVNCVAVCAKGEKIAIGLDGGRVKVLDSITNDVLFEDTEEHGQDISCISFSPDGSCLAAGSSNCTVQVWNTQTWTKAGVFLEGHEEGVTSVSFRADGKQIASSSDDGSIRLWDVESGNCVGISSKHSAMRSVSFIVDGERLISGSEDGIVRIWDARLGAESKEPTYGHTDRVFGVAISQNGLQVASASEDGTVRLWDTRTGKQIGKPMEGHRGWVYCVSFSPDGRCVVSGSDDRTLRLWDTETQTQIGGPFEGHARFVQSASFSFDGLRIVSGSNDETVRIWNAETLEQIGEALEGHQKSVFCVSESADGCHIVSRDDAGRTIIWNRESRAILWKSEEESFENEITDDEEESFENEITDDEKESFENEITDDEEESFENEITDDEAEQIIRSCGVQTPHLWPKSFAEYASELCYADGETYSNLLGGKLLLADLDVVDWKYHTHRKLFAAGLGSGAVTICKLITE